MPPRRTRPKAKQETLPFDSGATGGAATARGTNFQIKLAIAETLDLVSRVITTLPISVQRPQIWIEPRRTEEGVVTRWDIGIDPDNTLIEAKVNPSREDVFEWIQRSQIAAAQHNARRFVLAFGSPIPLTRSVERFLRVAKECSGDKSRFGTLVQLERIPDWEAILQRLGSEPLAVLERLELACREESTVDREIDRCLRFLVTPANALRLKNYLFQTFSEAMAERRVFFIPTLKRDIEKLGIEFWTPPAIEPLNLVPFVYRTFFVLRNCYGPIPEIVLASVAEAGIEQLSQEMAGYIQNGDVQVADQLWQINPLITDHLSHPDGNQLLARAVEHLLAFIKANRTNPLGRSQIDNLLHLAKKCEHSYPEVVAKIFGPLDKLLKRSGQKRLVFDLADLAIRCARRSEPRSESLVRDEAKALVCGFSWVFQRLDNLPEADAHALRSLELGQSVGYTRNTAFCYKCIGRLRRIQADREPRKAPKQRLLAESTKYLKDAITEFSEHVSDPDCGPDCEEVGDCYSLLARTYLSGGHLREAELAAQEARKRIIDPDSKDYMDLLILLGDLASAKFKYADAEASYARALELLSADDAEHSEIAARAWRQRGLNLHRWRKPGAADALRRAAGLWLALDEEYYAAEAEWQVLRIEERVPHNQLSRIEREPPPVRIETIRLYEARAQKKVRGALALRREAPDGLIEKLIKEARANASIRHREWVPR